jgi:hypothetical protein
MMIRRCQKRNQRKAVTCFGVDGGQGMQTVTNNVHRFVSLVPSFSAVTVKVIVNAYLFPVYMQSGKGARAVIGKFRRINSMKDRIAKKPGLIEMMKNIHQKIYLLDEGKRTSKLTELTMVDHILFAQRQADKYSVLFTIQAEIFFRAKFAITDFRVLYRFEQLGSKQITGEDIPHCRAIPIIGQQIIDDCVIKQLIDELELLIFDIDRRALVAAELNDSAFMYPIDKMSHLLKLNNALGGNLLFQAKEFFS